MRGKIKPHINLGKRINKCKVYEEEFWPRIEVCTDGCIPMRKVQNKKTASSN
jgi:hypothetical protein